LTDRKYAIWAILLPRSNFARPTAHLLMSAAFKWEIPLGGICARSFCFIAGLGVSAHLRLFAMWFSKPGIVIILSLSGLTAAERIGGAWRRSVHPQAEFPGLCRHASGIKDATLVRLIWRSDGPVYVVDGPVRIGAVRADALTEPRKVRTTGPEDRRTNCSAA